MRFILVSVTETPVPCVFIFVSATEQAVWCVSFSCLQPNNQFHAIHFRFWNRATNFMRLIFVSETEQPVSWAFSFLQSNKEIISYLAYFPYFEKIE
jgi:hypothetical protein